MKPWRFRPYGTLKETRSVWIVTHPVSVYVENEIVIKPEVFTLYTE